MKKKAIIVGSTDVIGKNVVELLKSEYEIMTVNCSCNSSIWWPEQSSEGWEQEFWIQDCSAASQNILLAAEAMGLGTIWTAAYPAEDRMETISRILHLPAHIVPLNVIPLGYPSGAEQAKNKWKSENLHWNKW